MNPLALPVHPIVVHFPIALLTVAWVSLLVGHLRPAGPWTARARVFETIGVAALPLTILAGFVDTRGVEFVLRRRWDLPLLWHTLVALAASATFAAHWAWGRRAARRGGDTSPWADVGLATAGLWLVLMAGLIAGEMVYAA
ncbi:MAG TPA: DUF2231 domain-containing protein [Acidimicrobiales bacterium]|nr:DUF2231 domain-containing protein [Acidimicrobiales bacterium]